MRLTALVLLSVTAACSTDATSPTLSPLQAIGAGFQNQISNPNRGAVEIFVKSNHPALIGAIQRGGGPTLIEAYDISKTPQQQRALQTLRLQSDLALYNANPGALVLAIMAGAS